MQTEMTVGHNYLVFTATYALVGTLVNATPFDLVLFPSAWVADTGRLHDALKMGLHKIGQSEIEPHTGSSFVPRGSIMYSTEYAHPIPTEQK